MTQNASLPFLLTERQSKPARKLKSSKTNKLILVGVKQEPPRSNRKISLKEFYGNVGIASDLPRPHQADAGHQILSKTPDTVKEHA